MMEDNASESSAAAVDNSSSSEKELLQFLSHRTEELEGQLATLTKILQEERQERIVRRAKKKEAADKRALALKKLDTLSLSEQVALDEEESALNESEGEDNMKTESTSNPKSEVTSVTTLGNNKSSEKQKVKVKAVPVIKLIPEQAVVTLPQFLVDYRIARKGDKANKDYYKTKSRTKIEPPPDSFSNQDLEAYIRKLDIRAACVRGLSPDFSAYQHICDVAEELPQGRFLDYFNRWIAQHTNAVWSDWDVLLSLLYKTNFVNTEKLAAQKQFENLLMTEKESVAKYASRVTQLAATIGMSTSGDSIPLGEKFITTIHANYHNLLGDFNIQGCTFDEALERASKAELLFTTQKFHAKQYEKKRKELLGSSAEPSSKIARVEKQRGKKGNKSKQVAVVHESSNKKTDSRPQMRPWTGPPVNLPPAMDKFRIEKKAGGARGLDPVILSYWETTKRCMNCGDKDHLRDECPGRYRYEDKYVEYYTVEPKKSVRILDVCPAYHVNCLGGKSDRRHNAEIYIGGGAEKDKVFIDTGADQSYIDPVWAEKWGLVKKPLPEPYTAQDVKGNTIASVEEYTELKLGFGPHVETVKLNIMELGQEFKILLGYNWICKHDPDSRRDKDG